jgi:nitrogen fixation/metabolism regulation signal transduction histidine kinase
MVYNKFLVSILIRVLLISATTIAFSIFLMQPERIFTLSALLILLLLQIYLLYKFVGRTNKGLANFLLSLNNRDSSLDFSNYKVEKLFKDLGKTYTGVIDEMQALQQEKEQNSNLLQSIVAHVPIGILTFDGKGKIWMANQAAKEIFGLKNLFSLKDLDKTEQGLAAKFLELKAGQQRMFKLSRNNFDAQLSIRATKNKVKGEEITLVSIQDIKHEMEENELLSYQNLIRVMNHEMMNSLTPITTLTTSIRRSFTSNNKIKNIADLDQESIADALSSSELIEERTKGLINFIQRYRELNQLKELRLANQNIWELFQNISPLLKAELDNKGIKLEIKTEPDELTILLDASLIEQVIINLVKNAKEAFGSKADMQIILSAWRDKKGKACIEIRDNAKGIAADQLKDIFVPFFTTKENGSGIGLSLSRQIMKLHGGNIQVKSELGKGSSFVLEF